VEKRETAFIVVGIGELLWDELPDGRQIGGAPANFVYHSQVLGAHSYLVSATGDDEAGREILQALIRHELETSYLSIDQDHATGSVLILLGADGVPEYSIADHVAWDFVSQTAEQDELAARADAVCFGTLAQRSSVSYHTIRAFLSKTRPNCLRIFDINLRQDYFNRHVIEESLDLANILKLNEHELVVLAGLLGLNGGTEVLLDNLATSYSLRVVALTRGERGCIIRTDEQTIEHEGFSQEKIGDTVGAGDCFSAVLTMGVLNNEPLDSIAAKANRMAAHVCTQAGAMPEMP